MNDENEFGLSDNAIRIFNNLYSFQNETMKDTFRRVAKEFATNKEEEEIAYGLLANNVWRPNTPVFLNAGTKHKVFSACYVVSLEDSMESIYNTVNVSRKVFQFGSGIGIPIGNLRERNAYIYEGEKEKPPEGKSSGPITFMRLYDAVGETTKSGGRVRRAAILCNMPVWHPDIMEFINCKEEDGRLSNMNISVAITDKFMEALDDSISFPLHSPSNGIKVSEINAEELWDRLAYMSWKSADPGMMFIDIINKFNTLKSKFLIECTNPCGEEPLIPFGCCNLSAIDVNKFTVSNKMHWTDLYNVSRDITVLMDNSIDVMDYPDERFEDVSKKYRQIGIGIMGLADAMFTLDIKYDSLKGKEFASKIMKTITSASIDKSAELADEKEPFHNYNDFKEDVEEILSTFCDDDELIMRKVKKFGVRNSQHTTCAPTGTTAISCDASYGIEPCFGLVFQKNLIDGSTMMFVNKVFEERFQNEPWYTDDLLEKIFNNGGSLKGIRGIPKEVREVFVTAHDIKPKDRIDVQSALQKYCSTAISSTINLPESTTKEDISELYKYAYEKGLKGITVYRDGSKKNQPVTFSPTTNEHEEFVRPAKLSADVFKIDTGNGTLYTTVSSSNGKPVELFLQIGKSGQVMNTLSEAVGRVVSIALQGGVSVKNIVKTLIGINSDKPVWSRLDETDLKPTQILSIPDGLAQLLDRYYSDNKYNGFSSDTEKCPECGMPIMMIEGCASCNCGYSRCG